MQTMARAGDSRTVTGPKNIGVHRARGGAASADTESEEGSSPARRVFGRRRDSGPWIFETPPDILVDPGKTWTCNDAPLI